MRALVTGGGGFLGSAIVTRLVERGDSVRSLSRGDYPLLRSLGVETIRGDITDPHALQSAVADCDIVFHVAAKAGVWGPLQEYQRINVEGTRRVIEACREHGISRLVYTSSPSVVFQGLDMEGADESAPYPSHYEAPYPQTKAEAERMILAANGRSLATVALRPHLIWGPGDNHLVPRILARARRLRRIGRVNKLIDATYIDNAAEAHVQAADRLAVGSTVAGNVYFIAQGEPIPIWDLVNLILDARGLPPVSRTLSLPLADAIARLFETTYRTLGLISEPPLTRFVVREMATAHWFDLTAARRDLGYSPKVTTEEGLLRLKTWLKTH